MLIISLDKDALDLGRDALNVYRQAILRDSRHISLDRLRRATGPGYIPGAVLGYLENGVGDRDELVAAVAHATLCRRSTVQAVLDAFEGSDPGRHFWEYDGREYRKLDRDEQAMQPIAAIGITAALKPDVPF